MNAAEYTPRKDKHRYIKLITSINISSHVSRYVKNNTRYTQATLFSTPSQKPHYLITTLFFLKDVGSFLVML